MSYTHTNKQAVTLSADPIDPGSTDWLYFSYGSWLRTGETISAHAAVIEGGTLVTDSTSLGSVDDDDGTTYYNVYGVEFAVAANATVVKITHRVSTVTTGAIDLGRTAIDHTAIIPVKTL